MDISFAQTEFVYGNAPRIEESRIETKNNFFLAAIFNVNGVPYIDRNNSNEKLEWKTVKQTATAKPDNTAVTFAIDDTNAEVNNAPATMDVPARLINCKTMVLLRFLSEEMGFEVTWDLESRTAIIE